MFLRLDFLLKEVHVAVLHKLLLYCYILYVPVYIFLRFSQMWVRASWVGVSIQEHNQYHNVKLLKHS